MLSKILTVIPNLLSFLANKSENNPKTALGTASGLAGLVGLIGSPELQAAIRNGIADVLMTAADVIRQSPSISG